ncbi:hypothetical protein VNI00_013927 [Paramarasmius palmivorus]|uniref:Transmembrane protein n=1 Tax=Paramarasmius palmivorus TaxID=297713 RepID=A0AAW0BXC2_9AGAR
MINYPSDTQFPRRIVIDDTDSRVKYETGTWSLDTSRTFDNLGTFGAAFNGTMHGTNQNTASFSFTFEGEYVSVWGTKDNRKIQPNDDNEDDLTELAQWQCQVDGSPIQRVNYITFANCVTNLLLCETDNLDPNIPHVLTLNVSITNPPTQMFWLDKIEYMPGPKTRLAGETMKFDSTDVNVRYDNNWVPDGDSPRSDSLFEQTATTGASVTFKFNGTNVSLYGFNDNGRVDNQSLAATSGRYNIDGGNENTFTIPGSRPFPANSTNLADYFNEFLFTSPELNPGPHLLTVTFTGQKTGNESLQPLIVDYFYVTASAQDSDAQVISKSKPMGAIVGGIVGGVVVLALLGLAVFLSLRRRRKSWDSDARASVGYLARPVSPPSEVSPYPYVTPSLQTQHLSKKEAYDSYQSDSGATLSPATYSSHTTPASTPQDSEALQQAVFTQDVVERRHQDSGIRYPQAQRVVDIPPDYTLT